MNCQFPLRTKLFWLMLLLSLLLTVGQSCSSSSSDDENDSGDTTLVTDVQAGDQTVDKSVSFETMLPDSTADLSTMVSFSQQVLPLLVAKCKKCHGQGAGGFVISGVAATDYAEVLKQVQTDNPGASKLLLSAINSGGSHGAGDKIITKDSSDYDLLLSWITAGAPDN